MLQFRPFLPKHFFRTRAFITVSGSVSLFVLIFNLSVHTAMIYFQTAYALDPEMAWFSAFLTQPMMVFWASLAIVGPLVSICMLDHLLQNTQLSLGRKAMWAPAIVSGLGLFFYWYFHLFPAVKLEVVLQTAMQQDP